MSLLLPQTRAGEVRSARPVDIHGDRHVDVRVVIDGEADGGDPRVGRVPASDCAANLRPGERVTVRFVMGVMTRVTREAQDPPA